QNDSFKEFIIPENGSVPASLAMDLNGKIWFSDQSGAGSVWSFNPVTKIFAQYKTLTPKSNPLFVLIDDSNNVWFTETTQNKLGELRYPNYNISEFELPSSSSGPVELAFGLNQSTIWITETFTGKIASFSVTSHSFNEFSPPSADYLKSPVGIVSDSDGNVWVSEHGGSAVVELVPTNSTFKKYPTSIPSPSVYPVSAVATIALDSHQRLWFVEHFSNRVGRLDPKSNVLEEFQIPTSQPAYSVLNTLDRQGNFWFTEFSSNQIAEVAGNISSPLMTSLELDPQSQITAGKTITSRFLVTNNLSTSLVVRLNTTSSFTATGLTNSQEVFLNSTVLTIPAGGTQIVSASITPDSSLASGIYSVGIIASAENVSTIGIAFLSVQGQFSAVNWISSNYQVISIAIIVLLGLLYFGFFRRKARKKVA
ncbi:MAG: hypothetical protein OK457_07700, partial [Thaumarchaeota archaeon]|nr:hypothetical protein [Nitrososphaerota archaeon]